MEFANPSDESVRELLKTVKTIAVVGLSSKAYRASHGVSAYMKERGYQIIPVNPNEDKVLGEISYPPPI
jgi:predicted CoA-binding protein